MRSQRERSMYGSRRKDKERLNTPSSWGVLVVIAIIAITLFRPKIQELWDAISSGINGL